MVSYRSMLVIWCVLGMYVVSLGSLMTVLIGIVFYGGLMIVTMLIVIPNRNAHYYYNSLLIRIAVVGGTGSMYLRILTIAIIMMILIF